MISMKNLAKGILYATIIILLVGALYLGITTGIANKSFRDEYKRNNERINEQQRRWDETQQQIMGSLNDLEDGVETVIGRIETIQSGVELLKGYNRELTDVSIESELLSDRDARLLQELEQRIATSQTE